MSLLEGCPQTQKLQPRVGGVVQVEKESYDNIALSLGVDAPGDVLFATDSLPEAQAATAAGWRVRTANSDSGSFVTFGSYVECLYCLI